MNDTVVFQKALEDIGMSGREIFDVFRIVAGVLKLGNVEFVPTTNMDGTEGCGIANEYGELKDLRRPTRDLITVLSQNSTMCLNY